MLRTVATIAALGIGLSSAALAQGQPGWGWWGGPGWGGSQGYGMGPGYGMGAGNGMGPGAGMMMGAIDTDQSGDISAEEAAAHAELMFATMDVNGDGGLVTDEMGAGRMGMMNPWGTPQLMKDHHAARFAAKDADSNGTVTMAEFLAAEKAQYDAADTDGDGKVSPWELRAAMWQ